MWDVYLHEGNYENGDIASDHYHHYKEDIEMMAKGGQNTYRLSLSWLRIIKDKEGTVNEKGHCLLSQRTAMLQRKQYRSICNDLSLGPSAILQRRRRMAE